MDGRLKLAQGLRNLPPSARQDLAQREQDIQRGKTVELLRRAGKEMYDNPIVNTAIGFTPGVGDVQAGVEAYRSANEGDWTNAGLNALGMLPFIPALGKTVWHGSPRTFDKFDLDLARENNVRSARGEGLYLSESSDFAGKFRGSGSFGLEPGETQGIANILVNKGSKGEEFARKVYAGSPDIDEKIAAAQKAIDETSSLYKVDLPDEQIAKMLDYDLPLADQSEYVKQALMKVNDPYINEALLSKPVFNEAGDYWSYMGNTYGSKGEALQDVTPAQLVSGQAGNFKSPQELSQRLYEAGIPGSHYAERDTRNYVVFSDEIPQILERNNQPLVNALRNTEYRGSHTAPGPDFGARLDDLTGGGQMYPEDVYSPQAVRYYGTGDTKLDKESFAIAQRMRNKPDEMIDIYRAVPNDADIGAINAGDWVTINPNYAKQHGESNLPEGYKILSQKVPAKSVWTNADSIHEYGYWPE